MYEKHTVFSPTLDQLLFSEYLGNFLFYNMQKLAGQTQVADVIDHHCLKGFVSYSQTKLAFVGCRWRELAASGKLAESW